MLIEAVTVCANYSDFLAESARHNRHIFDRWIVITRPEDKETIAVCKANNLQCMVSDEFGKPGEAFNFNKGRAISLAMTQFDTRGWIVHLDADVVLPRDAKRWLEIACYDESAIYGMDRVCLYSWEQWKEYEASAALHTQHGHQLVAMPPKGDLGCRVLRGEWGYVPIGFFQMWHGQHGLHEGWRYIDYPHTNSTAAHSDIKFALRWPRSKRILIPEIFAVHLESERVQYGANWKGRKTKPFGPDPGASRGVTPRPS